MTGHNAERSRNPAATRGARLWIYILSGIVVIALTITAARLSLYRPINADEAYNLQIAKSIGTNFCYCTRYRPERVFPVEESTNGPVQYVAGLLFALTHSPDVTKAGTTAAAMLLLGAVLLILDPWLVLLAGLLFLVWYAFVYVSVNVVGEPWAIAFSLLGFFALRRCDFSAPLRSLLTSRAAVIAMACFAMAAESKLVASLAIVPVTWAIAYQRGDEGTNNARMVRASYVTIAAGIGTAFALLLLVAFSVIHSTRSVNPIVIWQTFTGYLFNMLGQGQGQAQPFDIAHTATIISTFSSPIVLALFVLSAAVLVYANRAYAVFLAVTLVWWLHYGVNERHVVISIFLTIVLAGLEAHALIERTCAEKNISSVKLSASALGAVAAIAVVVGLVSHSLFDAPSKVKLFPNRERVVQTFEGRYHYSDELVKILRQQRYVATSGWFQFSELTLRENLEFYDRMSPANASLPRDQVTLFLDRGNVDWPRTSIQANCGRIIYAEGPLVLCNAKRNVPLDFQPAS